MFSTDVVPGGAGRECRAVGADAFARYAELDLDRWRQLVGCNVDPADARWGIGRVEDVRWEPRRDRGPSSVSILVRYANVGRATVRAGRFGAHHRRVAVPAELDDFIQALEDAGADDALRETILARHSRSLREARDRAQLERSKALRRKALARDGIGG